MSQRRLRANTALKRFLLTVNRYAFYGRTLECPCCDRTYRRFLRYGLGRRRNARCPGCLSLERHRMLWLYLRRQLAHEVGRMRTVLHFAPEESLETLLSAIPGVRYVSVDLFSKRAMIRCDAIGLPIRSRSVDVVICSHVLEHVPDDRAALHEIHRILRPGGWAMLETPVDKSLAATREDPAVTSPEERVRLFGQADHVRMYGRDKRRRIEAAGFEVDVITCADWMTPDDVVRFALLEDEDLYVCHKPVNAGVGRDIARTIV